MQEERKRVIRQQLELRRELRSKMKLGVGAIVAKPQLEALPDKYPNRCLLKDDTASPAVNFELLEILVPRSTLGSKVCLPQMPTVNLYSPLPDNWFRLLIIEPGHGQLRCHLRPVRLQDAAGKYSALSYCWSQNVRRTPHELFCNGLRVDAGDNLRLALVHIRHRFLPRIVWVDAICINQADLAERTQQVQLMGTIYRQALKTVVWLGDGSEERFKQAFSVICKIVNNWDQENTATYRIKTWPHGRYRLPREARGERRWYSWIETHEWDQVFELFRCPWFERRWVIQEVALSQCAVLLAPGALISWQWVGIAAAIIRTRDSYAIQRYRMYNVYHTYLMFRLAPHGTLPPLALDLLALLRLTTTFKTSEGLDRVFGLLGVLARDNESESSCSIRADYRLSERELRQLVAEYCMTKEHPLSFLSDAIGLGQDEQHLTEPSWLPQWNERSLPMLDPWELHKEKNWFKPANRLQFRRFASSSAAHLAVEGIEVTRIAWRTPTFGTRLDFESTFKDVASMAKYCWSPSRPLSVMAALGQTFCAGRDEYGGRDSRGMNAHNFSNFLSTWLLAHDDEAYGQLLSQLRKRVDNISLEEVSLEGVPFVRQITDGVSEFIRCAGIVCPGRCLFLTASGHLGLGPAETTVDDVVCVFGGAIMPYILRKCDDYFHLVGESYVDGMMDGEVVTQMERGQSDFQGPINTNLFLQNLFQPHSQQSSTSLQLHRIEIR